MRDDACVGVSFPIHSSPEEKQRPSSDHVGSAAAAVHLADGCLRELLRGTFASLTLSRPSVSASDCVLVHRQGSMIIVNNSVDRLNLNRVNAMCQALASLFRAVLPLSAGALWSALMDQPWPIQPHGLYVGLSVIAVWMVVNGRMLDPLCGRAYTDREKHAKP